MNEKEKFQHHLDNFVALINNSYHELYFSFLHKLVNIAKVLELDIKIENYYKAEFIQRDTKQRVNIYAVSELLEQIKKVNLSTLSQELMAEIVFIQYSNSNSTMSEYLRAGGVSFKNERRYGSDINIISFDSPQKGMVDILGVENYSKYEKYLLDKNLEPVTHTKPAMKL